MVRNRKPGFISAGALALLFTGLAVSVSLGRGLQEAARASAEDVQAIRAALVFEDRLIRAVGPTEPSPSPALLLLGRGVDLESERGVECVGDLPAPSDPGLVERARAAKAALGERVFVLGHHYQRDEVIAFADVTGDSFKLAQQAAAETTRLRDEAERLRRETEAKREQSLESLAHKVAGKVLKYRRSVTLEPMNAYERHVIHAALQDKAGVTTYSVGTEPNRRVVVAYDRGNR